jgi:chromosome partitioning protein
MCVLNDKGGVGKTSCCQILGEFLALIGKRVLLIDGDYSLNLTRIYYFSEEMKLPCMDLGDLLLGKDDKSMESFIATTYLNNLYVLPGASRLKNIERASLSIDRLKNKLDCDVIHENFDIVIIDSHPSREYLTEVLVTASEKIIVPFFAETLAIFATVHMVRWIEKDLKKNVAGIVVSKYENTRSAFKNINTLYEINDIGPKVCRNKIPKANVIDEYQGKMESVVWKKTKHKVIEAYACLCYEILNLGSDLDAKKILVEIADKRQDEIKNTQMENLKRGREKIAGKGVNNGRTS